MAEISALFLKFKRSDGPRIVERVAAKRNLPCIACTYFGPYRSASYAGRTANVPPIIEMAATVEAQNTPK